MRGPLFLAGEAVDAPAIADICRQLRDDVRGVVAIESAVDFQTVAIEAPSGMHVTWLVRSDGTRARGRGERIAYAFDAWMREWFCGPERIDWMTWFGPGTPPHAVRVATAMLAARTRAVPMPGGADPH